MPKSPTLLTRGLRGKALSHGGDVGVGLDDGVMRDAARVADGGDELIAEVVLGIEREVLGVGGGQVGGIGGEADASADGQIGAVEGGDGVRVCRKAEERVWGLTRWRR